MTNVSGKKSSRNTINHGVPNDLIIDILGKLPVKSLVRFKCVSKQWFSSITDSDFTERHLSNQKKNNLGFVTDSTRFVDSESGCIMMSIFNDFTVINGIALPNTTIPDHRSWMFRLHLDRYDSTNSCDGILCFHGSSNYIHVLNPSTREYRSLPLPFKGPCHRQLGFGRDLVTKRYKIVNVFAPLPRFGRNANPESCEIFTLDPNPEACWKNIGEIDNNYKIEIFSASTYVNGVIYWFTDELYHLNKSEVIVMFDLHVERFKAVPHPSSCSGGSRRRMQLGSLRESLCLAQQEPCSQLSIWIMESNQHKITWEKLYCVNLLRNEVVVGVSLAFAVHKNGTLLVYCEDKLHLFNQDGESCCVRHGYEQCMVSPFTQSLVPIYGNTWSPMGKDLQSFRNVVFIYDHYSTTYCYCFD